MYFGANQHKKIQLLRSLRGHFVSTITYRWSTMTNEHWRIFTQIDASFCLELNVFGLGCSYVLEHLPLTAFTFCF